MVGIWDVWWVSLNQYPPVKYQKTMEDNNFQWVNQRTKWEILIISYVSLPKFVLGKDGNILENK